MKPPSSAYAPPLGQNLYHTTHNAYATLPVSLKPTLHSTPTLAQASLMPTPHLHHGKSIQPFATSSDNEADTSEHEAELKMMEDIGIGRAITSQTVGRLLREMKHDRAITTAISQSPAAGLDARLELSARGEARIGVDHKAADANTKSAASTSSKYADVPKPAGAAVSDFQLLTVMTSRVTQLERSLAMQQREISEKNATIDKLKLQLHQNNASTLQQSPQPSPQRAHPSSSMSIEESHTQLLQQVREMEALLADYGMLWNGYRADVVKLQDEDKSNHPDGGIPSSSPPSKSVTPSPSASPVRSAAASPPAGTALSLLKQGNGMPPFNVTQFIACLRELSSQCSNHEIITNKAGVTKFQSHPAIHITLYKDGLWLYNGPLRTWDMKETQEFFQDVLDGYFPFEFKSQYPEGVVFTISDKSSVSCQLESSAAGSPPPPDKFIPFSGVGHRLEHQTHSADGTQSTSSQSSSSSPSTVSSSSQSLPLIPALSKHAPKPAFPSKEAFLSHLPASVIKDGKIIPVRDDIAKLMELKGSSSTQQKSAASDTTKAASAVPANSTLLNNTQHANTQAATSSSLSQSSSASSSAASTSSSSAPSATSSSSGATAAPPLIVVESPALRQIARPQSARGTHRAVPVEVTSLHIKFDHHATPLLLKMRFDDTLEQVFEYVKLHRPLGSEFELRSHFPARTYERSKSTLRSVGLVPNASLLVRSHRPASGYRQREEKGHTAQPAADTSAKGNTGIVKVGTKEKVQPA